VARVFDDLPPTPGKRLLVVDAGIATKEQFAAATEQDALLGRLRINTKLRCAPPPPTGKPGRRPVHGEVIHPGRDVPEVAPDVERHIPGEAGLIRLRRWHLLHYEECPAIRLDVVRIDDPAYDAPLLVGTTAGELTSEEGWVGYRHRWPVETNFFVAQDTTAMEMPRAWTETALAVESHRGGLRAAGDGSVGSPARAFGGSPSELARSPCVAFCGSCPRRRRTEKLSKKSKRSPEKGLTATKGCVNW
jgi:hypothetical protein